MDHLIFETEEIDKYILHFTSNILENILINYQSSHSCTTTKKQENYMAFPFSISLESSKVLPKFYLKPELFHKKKSFTKDHSFSALRKPSNEISELFFHTYDDLNSPHQLTKKMLHQMENEMNFTYILPNEKENDKEREKAIRAIISEEIFPNNSTFDTVENQQKQTNEEKRTESIDNDDKEILDLLSNNETKDHYTKERSLNNETKVLLSNFDTKEFLSPTNNNMNNTDKTIDNFEEINHEKNIDDENIPSEVKTYIRVPALSPTHQKVFSDLDNSNITYLEETPLLKNDGKINKLQKIFDRNIVREGWFLRKTKNFISGWESVWILLTQEKLQYFSDKTKTKLKGGINFRLAKCSVSLKDYELTIKIKGYNKFLQLKTSSKTFAREWAKLIDDIIFNNQTESKLEISHENMGKYMNDDFMSEKEFQLICETGDILLFETKNFPAKFQRTLTGSKYDHVALVMKFEDEAWIFDAQSEKGVSLLKWSEFIDVNDLFTKVVYRKLNYDNKETIEEKMFTFIAVKLLNFFKKLMNFLKNNMGKKYELSLSKILFRKKSLIKIENISTKKNTKTKNDSKTGFFCSELVAAAYKELGLLDSQISATTYWPGNFSTEKNLNLLSRASLSEEISVVMDRDLI